MLLLRLSDDVIVNGDSIASVAKLPSSNGGAFDVRVMLKNRGFAPHPTRPKEIVLVNAYYTLTGADAERVWGIVESGIEG